jgi:hypothetical protein
MTPEERQARRDAQRAATAAHYEAERAAHRAEHVAIVADALRGWQRAELSKDFATKTPTTLWIDRAEEPAAAAIDALLEAGVVFARMGRWDE